MKQKIFFAGILLMLMFSVVSVAAAAPENDMALAKGIAQREKVIEAGDSGYFLKHQYIVHYAQDMPAKPDNPNKPAKPGKTPTCYSTFSQWRSLPVSYLISTYNTAGMDPNFLVATLSQSAETWDDATSQEIFNDAYTVTPNDVGFGAANDYNALLFRDWADNSVIAITSIWSTPGKKGQIVDFDTLFNTYYSWGDGSIDPTVMDLQNIATHELGHGLGLDDIYTSSCDTVTMYGYSWEGDIEKRTLEQPDITGLQKLYGA